MRNFIHRLFPCPAQPSIKPSGDYKAGQAGEVQIVLDAKAPFHANDKYPYKFKLADVKGRAIMIHAGGDNYSDQPAPLGGGGARIACGVIK